MRRWAARGRRTTATRRLQAEIDCAWAGATNKLTDQELGQILDVLRWPRLVGLSPAQVLHILLDEGR